MKKQYLFILSGLLLIAIAFSVVQMTQAVVPNPGHGTSALEGDGDLNMNSNKITNLLTPVDDADAATKAYVDAQAGGGGSDLYWVGVDCKTCTNSNADCTPAARSVAACPEGYTQVSFADASDIKAGFISGGIVMFDSSLTCATNCLPAGGCPSTTYCTATCTTDINFGGAAVYSATASRQGYSECYGSSRAYVRSYCAYRVCAPQ